MNKTIDLLQHRNLIWQASRNNTSQCTLASGFPELDQQLNGGFPKSSVIELRHDLAIGELRLLTPLLSQLPKNKLLVFIDPPAELCGQMLLSHQLELQQVLVLKPKDASEAAWAAEQCLKSGACAAALLWLRQPLAIHQAKRLQLAAETGDCLQFLFNQQLTSTISLPLPLSLQLDADPNGIQAQIRKRKGGWPSAAFSVAMSNYWPALTSTAPQATIKDNLIHFPQSRVS